jgi:predicted alpha/beta hydrolase
MSDAIANLPTGFEWGIPELGPKSTAPQASPAGSEGTTETAVTLAATDGHPLTATLFEPDRPNGIAVQINPAYAVTRGYYTAYARYLALRGFTVLTYDYRGTGGSVDPQWRGDKPTMRHWGERDVAGAIDWMTSRYPNYRHVHVGHSAGGQLLGLASNNRKVEALLTIGAQAGPWKNWDFPHRLVTLAWFHAVVPVVARLSAVFPALRRNGFDVPPGVALEWARWGRGPHYISDERGQPLREYFERYTGRVRLYHITDDPEYAPRRAVQALAGFYRNARVEVLHRSPADWGARRIGHFGFFRSQMPRFAWEETARWLSGTTAISQPQAAKDPIAFGLEEYA